MRTCLSCFVFFGLALSGWSQTLEGTRAEREAWKKEGHALAVELSKKEFPIVEFKEATLAECVHWLKAQGIGIEMSPEFDAPAGGAAEAGGNAPASARVTLSLKNVPALEVIKCVANLANAQYRLRAGKVLLQPMETGCHEVYSQNWEGVPAEFFRGAPEVKTPQGYRNVVGAFQRRGFQFPEWAFALYSPDSKTLLVRHSSKEVIEKIDDLLADFAERTGDEGKSGTKR